VELLRNYLTGRKQQIKLQEVLSSWADIQKGIPQGSILDPLLFNILINDIFYFIEYGTLYNYADDNTLTCVNDNYEKLIDILEKESY
jgi:retron-type reverse transcriptase